jgi:hypothetical protein
MKVVQIATGFRFHENHDHPDHVLYALSDDGKIWQRHKNKWHEIMTKGISEEKAAIGSHAE